MQQAIRTEAISVPAGESLLLRDTRIREIATQITDCPIRRRHVQSNTTVSVQSYVHVKIVLENGGVGWGEASSLGGPRWSEESAEAIRVNIERYLKPALIGRPACLFEENHHRMGRAASRNFSAKAALDMAMIDAVGRSLDLPAAQFLGGSVRDRFPVIWGLSSGDAGMEIEEAKSLIAERLFNRFKIKLGFLPVSEELRRLRTIRDALGPEIELIVDVNQAWSEATCRRFLPVLEELGIALIEQPLPSELTNALAGIAPLTSIPILLDEGCFTPTETLNALRVRAGSVVSLKLVKSGGMWPLKGTAAIAKASGAELYGGCLLESSLGAAAHLQVFSSLPSLEWGTEHFGPCILVEDLADTPLVYKDFEVHLPDGPGLGVTPSVERLEKYRRRD